MGLIEVKITGQAITAQYGTLNSGDILRTDAEFARHLVEDCGAAEYVVNKQSQAEEQLEVPRNDPKSKSTKRHQSK